MVATKSLNRRLLARVVLQITCLAVGWFAASGLFGQTTSERPNVLFIAIDDLNDWVGCMAGHPQAYTPRLDALAARGTLFLNAHCQSPLCNSSRASVLTGLRPSTTGIYGLTPGIHDVELTRDWVTLPQSFTQAGYFTYTCGKIFHDGSVGPAFRQREFQAWGPAPGMGRPEQPIATLPEPRHPLMDWGAYPEVDEQGADYQIASAAVEALANAPADRPFFVACGFRLPHVPCFAPQHWFDRFPDDQQLILPPVLPGDRDDTPMFSWYLHWKLPEPRLSVLQRLDEWRPLVRAYLASTAYMDAQLGRVLDALEATGRANRTIVVVWSDHGWHLGEKGITGKNSLWERSTRVPLVFAGPGVQSRGRCPRPVELLDIFPTLLELAGLPPRGDLEGRSLAPLLKDDSAARPWPAITTHNPGNHAVRSEKWRYIRYADGSEELYDMAEDPHEWNNLADAQELRDVKDELSAWLKGADAPHAPGSAHRILMYDAANKQAIWEGSAIVLDQWER